MADLFNCLSCGKPISTEAKSCPNCGHNYMVDNKKELSDEYLKQNEKSRAASFLFTLFLGPLGLFYSSVVWGAVLLILAIASSPTIVGPAAIWIISIIAGDSFTYNYNKNLKLKLAMS